MPSECLCDVQNEDLHLPGGRPATAPLRLHQRSEEAGCHSETTLHLHVREMSRGKTRQAVWISSTQWDSNSTTKMYLFVQWCSSVELNLMGHKVKCSEASGRKYRGLSFIIGAAPYLCCTDCRGYRPHAFVHVKVYQCLKIDMLKINLCQKYYMYLKSLCTELLFCTLSVLLMDYLDSPLFMDKVKVVHYSSSM